jgi:hypothetical protein
MYIHNTKEERILNVFTIKKQWLFEEWHRFNLIWTLHSLHMCQKWTWRPTNVSNDFMFQLEKKFNNKKFKPQQALSVPSTVLFHLYWFITSSH